MTESGKMYMWTWIEQEVYRNSMLSLVNEAEAFWSTLTEDEGNDQLHHLIKTVATLPHTHPEHKDAASKIAAHPAIKSHVVRWGNTLHAKAPTKTHRSDAHNDVLGQLFTPHTKGGNETHLARAAKELHRDVTGGKSVSWGNVGAKLSQPMKAYALLGGEGYQAAKTEKKHGVARMGTVGAGGADGGEASDPYDSAVRKSDVRTRKDYVAARKATAHDPALSSDPKIKETLSAAGYKIPKHGKIVRERAVKVLSKAGHSPADVAKKLDIPHHHVERILARKSAEPVISEKGKPHGKKGVAHDEGSPARQAERRDTSAPSAPKALASALLAKKKEARPADKEKDSHRRKLVGRFYNLIKKGGEPKKTISDISHLPAAEKAFSGKSFHRAAKFREYLGSLKDSPAIRKLAGKTTSIPKEKKEAPHPSELHRQRLVAKKNELARKKGAEAAEGRKLGARIMSMGKPGEAEKAMAEVGKRKKLSPEEAARANAAREARLKPEQPKRIPGPARRPGESMKDYKKRVREHERKHDPYGVRANMIADVKAGKAGGPQWDIERKAAESRARAFRGKKLPTAKGPKFKSGEGFTPGRNLTSSRKGLSTTLKHPVKRLGESRSLFQRVVYN